MVECIVPQRVPQDPGDGGLFELDEALNSESVGSKIIDNWAKRCESVMLVNQ